MVKLDWVGDYNSIYKTLGASNHTDKERQTNDFYATEPKAAELLLEQETFHHTIWECACGQGHLAEVFRKHGHEVIATDLIYRGYGDPEPLDFLQETIDGFDGDIITNPPYRYAFEFVEKALESVKTGRKVAMFLKLQFLEGKKRKELYERTPPQTVYVSSSRLLCAKNADFKGMKEGGGSAVAYAWFVWVKGYTGETVIKWIN